MEFKDIFLELRKERGIAQEKLAEELETSNAIISYWENGKREPTLYMLKKIARFFNVSMDYLSGNETNIKSGIKINNSFNNNKGKINFKG